MKKIIYSLITYSIFVADLFAQDYPRKDFNPSSLVDEIFATQDLSVNYQDLYENYLQLLSNPIDLNEATDEQLSALYVLSPQQIQSFLTYRKEAGSLLSIYELQSVPGFSKELFLKLVPFVTVKDASSSFNRSIFNRVLTEKNNYLLLRYTQTLEQQKGYLEKTDSSSRYAGKPGDFYARFRTSKTGDFSLGFTLKIDAGEAIAWDPSKKYYGFDYISFHAQTLNKGKIKNLIIGDYQAQFGQGIALGSVFGIGKNGEAVTTVRRSNLGFLPYTSIYEAGYFRGAAITYQAIKNLTIHGMVSSRGRDGSFQDSTQSNISSFNFTGSHRTPTELANRNALLETNFALVANYKNQSLDAGLLIHRTQFDVPLRRNLTPYNQFYFNGNENTNVGAFLNYSHSNYTFFSEFVQTLNQGNAVVAGMLASLTPKLDVSLLYRKFDKNFYSFYSNALAENSIAQNESGVYWGWKYSFNKKYSFAGYADLFRFPWLKYRSYSPSDGSEWLVRFNYKPSKTVYIFLQAREEIKQRNTSTDVNLYLTDLGTRRNYWINVDYAATPQLSFKSRAQFSTYQFINKTTQGMAIMQDVSFDWQRLSLSGRYVLFDTDDFDNRLYAYERDVWLAFSFPAYNGKGARHFILMEYRLTKKIDLWLRWAQTRYTDRDAIGSGGETIVGNTQNDVRFQVRIRL
ncbi:MAG: ComEA family DNA-binding protein [Cyclobacteriaceae bacterium]